MNVVEIIRYISNLSPIIPFILILGLGKERFQNKTISILCLLIFISALTDLITYVIGSKQQSTTFISNLYTPLEFIILAWLYSSLLSSHKKLFYSLVGFFITFFIIDSLMIEPLSEFQSYTLTLEGIILSIFSAIYFVEHLIRINTLIPISNEAPAKNLKESNNFYQSILGSPSHSNLWINLAVFFYFVMDIYLFSVSNYVFENETKEMAMMFWMFHNGCNILKNVLFAIGVYYAGLPKTQMAN